MCFSRIKLTSHGSPARGLAADVVILPLHVFNTILEVQVIDLVDHCGQRLFHRFAWQNRPVQIITVGVVHRKQGLWPDRTAGQGPACRGYRESVPKCRGNAARSLHAAYVSVWCSEPEKPCVRGKLVRRIGAHQHASGDGHSRGPQRQRAIGAYRHLAGLMAEPGWTAVRVRDFIRRGFKEQVAVMFAMRVPEFEHGTRQATTDGLTT